MTEETATGRRCEEVEITPEMIEAGVRAVDSYDAPFLDNHEKAELIIRAALAEAGHRTNAAVERGANRARGEAEPISI